MFAKAAGVPITELDALVSSGQLLAKDVLPQFGEELRKAANEGGALGQKLYTTRVQQGRFFNELEQFQNKIFKGGMDTGGANLFQTLTTAMKENADAAANLGRVFKLVLDVMAGASRVAAPVLGSLANVLGTISEILNNTFVNKQGVMIAGMAGMALALRNIDVVAKSLTFRLVAILALMDELISPFVEGRIGLLEMAIGEDLALGQSDLMQGMGDWFSPDAEFKQGLNGFELAVVNATQALIKLTAAIAAIMLLVAPLKTLGLLGKGGKKILNRTAGGTSSTASSTTARESLRSRLGSAARGSISRVGGARGLGIGGMLIGATTQSRMDHLYDENGNFTGDQDTSIWDKMRSFLGWQTNDEFTERMQSLGATLNRENALQTESARRSGGTSVVFDQKLEVINAQGMDEGRLSQEIESRTQRQIEDYWGRQMQQNYSGRN